MDLTLNLNSRLQPMHRHDLEDALQEILEKGKLGEVRVEEHYKDKPEKLYPVI